MKGTEYVLDLGFFDRVGLGYEVFSILKKRHINLLGMEAKASEKMSIKFQCNSGGLLKELIEELLKVEGIHTVSQADLMPFEKRERQLKTILDSVSDGVIAIDGEGRITHINEKAKEIFHIGRDEQAAGRQAREILNERIPIIETLKTGKAYKHKEIKMKKGTRTFHYLTTGVPVFSKSGDVIGAVATVKDYKEVAEIVSKVGIRETSPFQHIIFQSQQMRSVIETARMVAKSSSSILLRGESGTGKELFAKAIHLESGRAAYPFVIINCAALPESLLESELFGYEEGSFTGALKGGKKGLFEQADKGTLFLDEIGELSPHMQVRLLRVLQEGTIRRIGGNKEISVNVRIIAATHRNLEEMVKDAKFREDLYYRLNVVPLNIPPLRNRREDIPLLANHLIKKISLKLDRQDVAVDVEGMDFLMGCTWPGNVRQLENTLERVMNVIEGRTISVSDLARWSSPEEMGIGQSRQPNSGIDLGIDLSGNIRQLKEIIDEVEKKVLMEVLKIHDSSRKAGKVLGISNTTVINKARKHGIEYSWIN